MKQKSGNSDIYTGRIKATGLIKPMYGTEYTEQIKDGGSIYTVTVKNFVWKRGFRVSVGEYKKPDTDPVILITNNETGRTNALTYSHNERVYWKNVRPDKNGHFHIQTPTSWHTTIFKDGTYEKSQWMGTSKGPKSLTAKEGRSTLAYTKLAQRFADKTQWLMRHSDQNATEIATAVPFYAKGTSSFYNNKNYQNSDIKDAFTRPAELYSRIEALKDGMRAKK